MEKKQTEKNWYGFQLLDVVHEKILPDYAMTAREGRIIWMGPSAALSPEQREQAEDLTGKTVMPGMFNCHVHALATPTANPVSFNTEDPAKFALRGLNHLQQHLRSGVTFVRDMNGRKQAEVGLRDAIDQGIVIGPHYIISRQCLCMTGGHGSNTGMECDGPDACRRAAREQIKYGADLIKIMASGGMMSPGMEASSPQLTEEEMRAAIEEAHKAGKKTATHAHSAAAIKCAIRAGIDSVEHGTYLDDECVQMMLDRGVWLVPTLSAIHFFDAAPDRPEYPQLCAGQVPSGPGRAGGQLPEGAEGGGLHRRRYGRGHALQSPLGIVYRIMQNGGVRLHPVARAAGGDHRRGPHDRCGGLDWLVGGWKDSGFSGAGYQPAGGRRQPCFRGSGLSGRAARPSGRSAAGCISNQKKCIL